MKKKSSLGNGINSIEGNSWIFNKNVAISFDKHVRQSIPFYDLIQKYITSISEWFIKDHSIIYDLGCSTGETAKNIIKHPNNKKKFYKYYGLDNSLEMINLAKKKITSKNCKFKLANINKTIFQKKSDLFISLLLFPFLNLNERENLLKKIFSSLKKGGALIIVDKIYSSDPNMQDIFTQIYFDSKIENKLTNSQILNKAKSLRGSHYLYSERENIEFIKKNGFKKVDVFFKWFNFIGIMAIK